MTSGDVEFNPGSVFGNTFETLPTIILYYDIECLDMDYSHKMQVVKVIVYLNKYRISYMVIQTIMLKCIIRATAVRFLSDNPEWFIESIVGTS